MRCPRCTSPAPARQSGTTALGCQISRCAAGRRTFTERTGTPFNFLDYPTDGVLLVVLRRRRSQLSRRDRAELFRERGFDFTQEAVQEREERCAPLLTARLGAQRRGKAGRSWSVDET